MSPSALADDQIRRFAEQVITELLKDQHVTDYEPLAGRARAATARLVVSFADRLVAEHLLRSLDWETPEEPPASGESSPGTDIRRTGSRPEGTRESLATGRDASAQREAVKVAARAHQIPVRDLERAITQNDRLVRAVLRSYRLSSADIEDAVQNTWLKLFEHWGQMRSHEPGLVRGWTVTTARREALRLLRRSSRELATAAEQLPEASYEAAFDAELILSEEAQAMQQAFNRLPPRQQELLRMLVTEPALSHEEISATLGMPVGSIGPTRARALARLRTQIRQTEGQ